MESSSAKCKNTQKFFCDNIREICAKFPCLNCSKHCKEYIHDNPPEKFIGIKMIIDEKQEELGLSIWSWTFHNSVNLRLGKPFMDWETYYGIYIKNNVNCSEKCNLSYIKEEEIKYNKNFQNIPNIPSIPKNLLVQN